MATEMLWVSLEERSRTNSPRQRFHSQLFCKFVTYFCRTLYISETSIRLVPYNCYILGTLTTCETWNTGFSLTRNTTRLSILHRVITLLLNSPLICDMWCVRNSVVMPVYYHPTLGEFHWRHGGLTQTGVAAMRKGQACVTFLHVHTCFRVTLRLNIYSKWCIRRKVNEVIIFELH